MARRRRLRRRTGQRRKKGFLGRVFGVLKSPIGWAVLALGGIGVFFVPSVKDGAEKIASSIKDKVPTGGVKTS